MIFLFFISFTLYKARVAIDHRGISFYSRYTYFELLTLYIKLEWLLTIEVFHFTVGIRIMLQVIVSRVQVFKLCACNDSGCQKSRQAKLEQDYDSLCFD